MDFARPDSADGSAGRSLYAYTGGKPWSDDVTRPCLVFLHGALNDHSVWGLPARWFAHHGWRVLALDLPGHGRSPGPLRPNIAALADDVLDLLATRGVIRAALVGHSMGSLIALEAAARALDRGPSAPRIEQLVLVGTAVPMPVSDALLATAARDPQAAIEMVVAFSHSSLAPKPSHPGPGSWLRGGARALMQQVLARAEGVEGAQHNLFHHDFGLCNAYADGFAAAGRIAAAGGTRCALVLGARDRMTLPRAAREIGQRLGARTLTLPQAGHSLMQEDPEGLLRALRELLVEA